MEILLDIPELKISSKFFETLLKSEVEKGTSKIWLYIDGLIKK